MKPNCFILSYPGDPDVELSDALSYMLQTKAKAKATQTGVGVSVLYDLYRPGRRLGLKFERVMKRVARCCGKKLRIHYRKE